MRYAAHIDLSQLLNIILEADILGPREYPEERFVVRLSRERIY
jgi:hypothetical protein